MTTEVVMPQMGESIAEGTITKWLKQVGDRVERDEPLFEISTDKVDAEIPSPAAGTLTEIRFKEGETVEINTTVAVLDGGAAGAAKDAAPTTEDAVAKTEARKSQVAEQPQARAATRRNKCKSKLRSDRRRSRNRQREAKAAAAPSKQPSQNTKPFQQVNRGSSRRPSQFVSNR